MLSIVRRSRLTNLALAPAFKAKQLFFFWFLRVQWVVIQLSVITVLLGVLLWLSVFLYGAFYYSYMPAVVHEKPAYFKFRTDCISLDKRCSFPAAKISLMKNSNEILVSGLQYVVTLEMEMPESLANQQIGMFMVHLEFHTQNGDVVYSTDRSAMLPYKSPLLRTIETFVMYIPSFFYRKSTQVQTISVELTDNFRTDPYRPTVGAVVEIQSKNVEIYNAVVKIYARLTGLRYLLYNWPLFTAVIGIVMNFCFFLVAVFFFWFAFVIRSYSSQHFLSAFNVQLKYQPTKMAIKDEPVDSLDVKSIEGPMGSSEQAMIRRRKLDANNLIS